MVIYTLNFQCKSMLYVYSWVERHSRGKVVSNLLSFLEYCIGKDSEALLGLGEWTDGRG